MSDALARILFFSTTQINSYITEAKEKEIKVCRMQSVKAYSKVPNKEG